MRGRRELTFSEGPGQAFFTCYLIYYPHLNPSLATEILWVGPFGRRFPPVLPADFTEHHWYEGSGLALKEVLVGGWGLGAVRAGNLVGDPPSRVGDPGGSTGERRQLTSSRLLSYVFS